MKGRRGSVEEKRGCWVTSAPGMWRSWGGSRFGRGPRWEGWGFMQVETMSMTEEQQKQTLTGRRKKGADFVVAAEVGIARKP